MEKIAVYGSGTIGSCEATLIIGHGIPCTVIGHSERGLERCRKAVAQNWDDLIANGLASEDNKAAALELLTVTNDPAALAGCTYVFEAVAEGTAEKQAVYEAGCSGGFLLLLHRCGNFGRAVAQAGEPADRPPLPAGAYAAAGGGRPPRKDGAARY